MKRHAKALVAAVLAMLCLGASAAIALQTHVKGTDVSSAGTPKGFVSLNGLAVDASGGDLYAVDASGAADDSGALDRFNSSGSFQNQVSGTFSNPQDVAVDSSGTSSDGNAYLADTGNNLVRAFDATGTPVSSFDTDGVLDGSGIPAAQNPDGAFSSPCGLAVDQATGNLYVADSGHNRIWVFDSSGAYLDRISDSSLNGPCGLAFDSTGDLYVRNANTASVVKFGKAGATDFNFARTVDSNNATDVAVDTSSDHAYVDNGSQATEYDSSGSQVSAFGSFGGSAAIAADPASGKVYVADGEALHVFGPGVILPDVSTGGASNVEDTSATISGSVDPAGGPEASCSFQWGIQQPGGLFTYTDSSPCQPAGPFSAFQEVTADLSGLTAGRTYHYRVASTNANGTVFGSDQTFSTTNAPAIDVVIAPEVNATSARFEARVNPNGLDTSYRFEYGTDTSYGSSAPASGQDIGSGNSAVKVTQSISGLEPDTTYHYRLSATNAVDTSTSADRTIHTYPTDTPAGLPDNRAWEMVSPADKGGSDILGSMFQTVSSEDGDAISFASSGAFAGSGGTGIIANYVAQRGAEGWTTTGITPNQPPGNEFLPGLGNQSQYTGFFTPDLSRGVFMARTPITSEPNVAIANNLYRRDDLLSGKGPNPEQGAQYQLLSDSVVPITQDQRGFTWEENIAVTDTSTDLGHVAFESFGNLTQDAVDAGLNTGQTKLYEWDEGAQRLAGILPDGTPTVSVAGRGRLREGAGVPSGAAYTINTLSDDGSTVFFTAPPYSSGFFEFPGQNIDAVYGDLYARIDHAITVKLNQSERTDCAGDPSCGGDGVADPAPDPGGPRPASLWTATPDGRFAFFLSKEALTDDAPLNSGFGFNLYRYDEAQAPGQRLTYIVSSARTVAGVSDDGQYVYFTDSEPDLDPTYIFPSHSRKLYAWHAGAIRAVANATDATTGLPEWLEAQFHHAIRVSPDGQSVLFESIAPQAAALAGMDNTTAGAVLPCGLPGVPSSDEEGIEASCAIETYLYSYPTDTVACVSCAQTGQAPKERQSGAWTEGGVFALQLVGSQLTHQAFRNIGGNPTQHLSHALSDDGTKAFFTSFVPLVPTDTNGRTDAYQYDAVTGEVRLLSSGQCNCDSVFVEASPDGEDAFFVTAERLVGIDTDNNRDLYDARVNGGIAAQNPPPPAECQGDACQAPAGPPNDPTPASSAFHGAGNQAKARQKHRKHRKHRKHHRKAKQKQARHAKHATRHAKHATRRHG